MLRASRLHSLIEGLPRGYWLLWVGTLVNRLGGFVAPFLTLYLTGQRGISVNQAALMISLLGAGSFISQLTGGELTDRLGRRPMMLASFFITPVFMLLLGLARSLWLIAGSAFVLGFFTDLYRPAVSAAVADLVEPQYRTRGYGYIYWAINLGAAVAPVGAGFLAGYSYFALFIADAATTFVFGLLIFLGFRETRPVEAAHHAAHTGMRERFRQLGQAPVLLLFAFITMFFGMIYTQGYVGLPLDMASHGLEPSQYGMAIAVNGFLIILTTIPVSNMAARWPRFATMGLAAVFLGLGFGFTALASTLPLFMLSVGIWTLGEIAGTSVGPTIIADLSPIELRGLYQGIFGAGWGLAFFIAPLLGGWVYQTYGSNALWAACLVVGVLLCLAYLALGRLAASLHPTAHPLPSQE